MRWRSQMMVLSGARYRMFPGGGEGSKSLPLHRSRPVICECPAVRARVDDRQFQHIRSGRSKCTTAPNEHGRVKGDVRQMNFQIIDWCILVAYLAGSMYVGLRARKYVENMEGYFVAGRRVKVALGSATLIATEIGIVTFMYFGELGYVSGFSCFILGVIGFIGYMVIGKTGFIVAGLRALKIVTIPEYYELRYGRGVRLLGGILLFLGGVLNMGIFLKMDGLFLTQAMGLGQGMLFTVMTVMLFVVISYTILGGMFSVVVTDFIQFVVLSIGMLIATVFRSCQRESYRYGEHGHDTAGGERRQSGHQSALRMGVYLLDADRERGYLGAEPTGGIESLCIGKPGGRA